VFLKKTYDAELKSGKSSNFDYKDIFKGTNCTKENKFSYNNPNPCVLIKLNKV
jgi:hypothetical protein